MIQARLRPLAEADLTDQARYSHSVAGDDVAQRFFNAAIASLEAAQQMPRIGSARIGELSGIPGLRVRRIDGFPCGWYYFIHHDHHDHHDVVRLLADSRDLTAILNSLDPPA